MTTKIKIIGMYTTVFAVQFQILLDNQTNMNLMSYLNVALILVTTNQTRKFAVTILTIG